MSYIGRGLQSGAFRQLDSIASSFNGSTTGFTMQVNSTNVILGDANQILLSLGGVIQNPGTDFTISSSTLTFTTAPAANTSFFAILIGSDNGGTVTPTDLSVTTAKIAADNVTPPKTSFFNNDPGNAADLGTLHIKTADSGASVAANYDEIVIENSDHAGMSILTGTDKVGAVRFGDSGDNDIGGVLYNHDDNSMTFKVNAADKWKIDSTGNLIPGATTTGIYLGVTSATAPNLLDDYEEGDMTVTTHYAGSGSWNTADNADTLQYTKIGRQVTVTGQIDVDTYSSASGIGYINAPFTCVQGTEYSGSSTGLMRVAGSNGKNVGDFNVHVYEALARIYFDLNTANTLANGALAAFDSSMSIYISVTYNT